MSTLSPNMSLTLPTIGVDSGLIWEQSFNSDMNILDGHNHAVGSGVQINVSGVNFTSDLPLNDNNLTLVRSVRFSPQLSPLSGASDLGCVYVSGVDLYYNDENGNQIQMTAGGTVNATSSGISSGTATASFSSSVLVVNAASNTPANIQVASVLLGNTGVSGSKYLTLSPPSAMPANYNLVLPQLPAQTNVMTLDTSGNMSSTTWDQVGVNMTSIGADAIAASMDSTGTNAIIATMGAAGADSLANNRTRSTGSSTEGVGGVPSTSSCGTFSTTSTSFTPITNLSVTLTTSGRPVQVMLQPDGANVAAVIAGNNGQLLITDGSSNWIWSNVSDTAFTFAFVDFVAAGTIAFTAYLKSVNGNQVFFENYIMVAYEL